MILCCCCAEDPNQEVITDKEARDSAEPIPEITLHGNTVVGVGQHWTSDGTTPHRELFSESDEYYEQKAGFTQAAAQVYGVPRKEEALEEKAQHGVPVQPAQLEALDGPEKPKVLEEKGMMEPKDEDIFWIDVQKGDAGVGLEVETAAGMLLCAKLREGPITAWNQAHGPEHRVRTGCRILEVNGTRGEPVSMIQAMKQASALRIQLRHPKCFTIRLTKQDGKGFGICIVGGSTQKMSALKVSQFGPGVVNDWNREHTEKEVKIGDRIVAVNGIVHEPPRMLAALKDCDEVSLDIMRPY
mmetsp:Transcript_29775/g.68564  ORF Transcript_29775/g.68564 Transcript_29775/m.68564 type:complete len:299 (+) Transcript_29775:64-960(+)